MPPSGTPTGRWCGAAAAFLVRNGPVSPQDRWEEDPGYAPFTIAVEIAALLAAAELADAAGETTAAEYLRETADAWNARIERWLYVAGTDLATRHGVDGYYVRVAEPDTRGRRLAVRRVRAHQEPAAGSVIRARLFPGQPGCPCLRALRAACRR